MVNERRSHICVALFRSGSGIFCLLADDEIQRNKERASEIIPAIEAYLEEHGHYPEDLGDSVPKYIVELPKTVEGEDFLYLVIGSSRYYPGRFILGFELASRSSMGCGDDSKYEE